MTNTCLTCKYCLPVDEAQGECHFKPPLAMFAPPLPNDPNITPRLMSPSVWPRVMLARDFCKEFVIELVKKVANQPTLQMPQRTP